MYNGLYEQKYLKYKKKYLNLKEQFGGYTLKLDEWNKIENSGQHNCGIFVSDIYPKYILKCDTDLKLDTIIKINKTIQLFPNIIDSTKIDEKAYITMQKLDGDITNIYFNLFPKIVLKNMINKGLINKKQEETIFELFLGKCNYSMPNSKAMGIYFNTFTIDRLIDPEIFSLYLEYLRANPQVIDKRSDINIKGNIYKDVYHRNIELEERDYRSTKNKLDKFKKFSNVTFELYNSFMTQLLELLASHHEIFIKEIIKIKLLLIKLGYEYDDDKLDNYGYILSNTPIDDYRKFQAPRIFGKYLYIYFLDWESGFGKILENRPKLNWIIDHVNDGFRYFTANGQYYFKDINKTVIQNNSTVNLEVLGIDPEILKILQKPYEFDLSPFKHSFTTIEEVEKFIYN